MTENDIYSALLEIKDDIGQIRANTTSTKEWLTQHVADDKLLTGRVSQLELKQENKRGGDRVWALIYAAGGSLLGAVASYLGLSR